MTEKIKKNITIVIACLALSGCSHYQVDKNIQNSIAPQAFNQNNQKTIDNNWLHSLNDEKLVSYASEALNNNYFLKQRFYNIKIKEEELVSSKSLFYPTLDLQVGKSTSGAFDSSSSSTSNNASLNLNYELDVWEKISDINKKTNLELIETKALYKSATNTLVKDVAIAYYEIIKLNNLQDLYNRNIKNAQDYLDLVQSRYEQGIISVSDVYLARNSLYEENKKLIQNSSNLKIAIYELEKLLGTYPKGLLAVNKNLPLLTRYVKVNLPSQYILQKPDILAKWNALLAKDANLAFTHKQRLPSFNIQGSIQDTLEGNPFSWNLVGSIVAPIFRAGDLKAKENIAMYEVKQAEVDYLDTVNSSFVELESLLEKEKSLKKEYEVLMYSNKNAKKSLDIALDEYIQGISEYLNVLTSQEKYFSSQENLINIKMQIIENRFNLYNNLGGDYSSSKELIKENK